MRLFWASLLSSLALGVLEAAPKDLSGYFGKRSGSALLWDLEKDELAGVWNERRAEGVELLPGSLRKPFTFAALLESGMYSAEHRVRCPEGMLNGVEALAYSCNAYFDDAVKRMGEEQVTRGYARFGLEWGRPTWRLKSLLPAWRRLVARHREARMAPLFLGMRKAVEYGTARMAAVATTSVAGKTGTMREAALFAGFAPAERPRYLLLIHLEGGSGGGDAAPVAAKILADLFPGGATKFDPGRVSVQLFWQNPPRTLNLAPGRYPAGTELRAGMSRMRAPGPIEVTRKGEVYAIRASVALEDYVEAVLHGEAGGFRQGAAREAMAVAARTYAVRFRGRHREEGFDFCDTTHCQDARFVREAREELRAAAEATSGELLWWQGKPAAAYYHADSGGWLEGSEDAPYLQTRKDRWWAESEGAKWSWTVKAADLAAALGLSMLRPELRVVSREKSGRARGLSVFGHPADAAAFRTAVGRTMGWEKLPSRLFEVEERGRELVFRGTGRGHGIGLAQTSAERMAAAGKNYREILQEYYPGTEIGLSAKGLRWQMRKEGKLRLYSTQMARDEGLLGWAAQEVERWEKELGMQVEPVLRVYPSREAFRDATGIVDPVQGATRGRVLRLLPEVERGTVRHELLHALLEANTRVEHPLWFREGLVEALNGERNAAGLRTQRLIGRYGRERVLRFWREGLPADEVQK